MKNKTDKQKQKIGDRETKEKTEEINTREEFKIGTQMRNTKGQQKRRTKEKKISDRKINEKNSIDNNNKKGEGATKG